MNDYGNSQVKALPGRLRRFVVDQHYEKYTAIDQAVWRYVMRQNWYYLKEAAYYPYIEGLKRAGLSILRIPDLQTMNDSLSKIGWGAVTVDGFIPPAAFMEFQAYKVLVIASDIRQLDHIEYTPAPDIIHESAGHAPIIADEAYANYLRYFGEIGTKAIFSKADFELYEAVRKLSILKEMPNAASQDLLSMEAEVKHRQQNLGEPSEMALLSRLHWWTVEYGLIGTLKESKIYGAGLLSSIGESVNCMKEHVKKIPYTISAVDYPFDITIQQPQLFVTPDFQNLMDVLEAFASKMAFRTGGMNGIRKAAENGNTCTLVLNTGLQISGILKNYSIYNNQPCMIELSGPAALAIGNHEIKFFGRERFHQGMKFPIGKIKTGLDSILGIGVLKEIKAGANRDIEEDIKKDIKEDITLEYENGDILRGRLINIIYNESLIAALELENAEYSAPDYQASKWENYVLPIGDQIVSVFNGAADKEAFEDFPPMPQSKTWHAEYSKPELENQLAYARIRELREDFNFPFSELYEIIFPIWKKIKNEPENTWLCMLEILELIRNSEKTNSFAQELNSLGNEIEESLNLFLKSNQQYQKLIDDGLMLLTL